MTKEIISLIDHKIEKHASREDNLLNRIALHSDSDVSVDTLNMWYDKHMYQRLELERLREQIIEMLNTELVELKSL